MTTDVVAPPRFGIATAPPPPSTPPPMCSGGGTRRRTPPSTSEICTSPLLHILAGLSPATTTPRMTKRDVGDDDDGEGESFSQPSSRALSGKVLLQTLLPNLRVDEKGNNHGDDDDDDNACEREKCDNRDEEEESPSIACDTNGGDDAVRRALADMESRIVAHLDASVMSLSQKLENLLQQSFAQFLTQQKQQQQQQQQQQQSTSNEDKETELSSTPSRLIRASPSPSLINAFQNLCSDDQSSM